MRSIPSVWIPQHLYKIPLDSSDGDFAYMRLTPDQQYLDVVIVKTVAFLSIWDDSPLYDDGSPIKPGMRYAEYPRYWKEDRKLRTGCTQKHFDQKSSNPVPLAEVHFIYDDKLHLLNGITRTLWLLTNGAWAFPLACPKEYTAALRRLAELDGQPVTYSSAPDLSPAKVCKFFSYMGALCRFRPNRPPDARP
jgi:hypothetical protein